MKINPRRGALALLAWASAWTAMLAVDGHVDLANLAMLLVLGSTVAALWLPAPVSMAAAAVQVLAFNWVFVPPRGTFSIDLRQHALLLGALLAVNLLVAALMGRLRVQADRARHHARLADQLRTFGEALRDTGDPLARAPMLREALSDLAQAPVTLLLLRAGVPATDDADAALCLGEADADTLAGLWLALRQSTALGPGTGRHDELGAWILPMRTRQGSLGAACVPVDRDRPDDALRAHAQALCDQMGQALQRALAARQEREAREQAQAQGVRNALLAAISHDHRTPLATILGAASSLHDQGERLAPEQRRRLAATIVDEAGQLARLTDNTLQLARLDAPGVQLQLDWESAEEIVGSALRHARQRDPKRRVRARLEPGLPLLRCDALLLSQLLDNLIDNALKYSPAEAPVEILVRQQGAAVVIAVRDRGPGVPPAQRERVFEVFQRGSDAGQRRGAGVGLAVCRAIARAHGGELRLRPRGHGGSSFECVLPTVEPPPAPGEEPGP